MTTKTPVVTINTVVNILLGSDEGTVSTVQTRSFIFSIDRFGKLHKFRLILIYIEGYYYDSKINDANS